MNTDLSYSKSAQRALSVLRIVAGLLFVNYGTSKLFGFPAVPQHPTPHLLSLIGVAGAIEFFGGLLILLGLFTRPAAFILSGQMAVAYFMAHAPHSFWPVVNQGGLAVLFCFVFLYLFAAGGGPWSLDQLRRRGADSARSSAG